MNKLENNNLELDDKAIFENVGYKYTITHLTITLMNWYCDYSMLQIKAIPTLLKMVYM